MLFIVQNFTQNFPNKFAHNIQKIRFKSQNRIQKSFFYQNYNSISSNGKSFLSFSTHKGGTVPN